jgi:hypothetical protein
MKVQSQINYLKGDLCVGIPAYFQMTQPGSSTVKTSVPIEAAYLYSKKLKFYVENKRISLF